MPANVLLVEDEERMRQVIVMQLSDLDLHIHEAVDGEQAINIFENEMISLVITDLKLPKVNGMEVLQTIKKKDPEIPVIVITAYGSIENAVKAIQKGAFDYVTKPFKEEKLRSSVIKALKISRLTYEVRYLRQEIEDRYTFKNIVGNSPNICEVLKLAGIVSNTDTSVLITGESGTGKELLSRATHINSPRSSGPFLTVNCAAIPSTLMEPELFGYEKGAFTGAHKRTMGKFELASGGTLFLDEIGDMELDVQAKLLRILETGEYERLGGGKTIKADVRVIAATNKDLEKMVEEKRFREDLFYRINVFPIHIPPLRERKVDIPKLSNHFIQKFSNAFGRKPPELSEKAIKKLIQYPWKGNIRELKNVLERAMILCKGSQITSSHLILNESQEKSFEHMNMNTLIPRIIDEQGLSLENLEGYCIKYAMKTSDNNVSKAARLLGLSRATLRYRLEKMNE
ncbi:sigma-54 dependent transcriptional regulator [Desulfobacula sp.]|uniref:sigma-54-dependent transcriptional regulator n=1 Tax=Desulfobacula sp. TaxID=2593537 RepID=UPI0025C66C75|nr:sigma-54 dependent transcriptional regulator [Desulfobacula sp.]MBC2705285.1 sigma-54-dependent Fis family transcriptional regulator [Desulfobacula sp.]